MKRKSLIHDGQQLPVTSKSLTTIKTTTHNDGNPGTGSGWGQTFVCWYKWHGWPSLCTLSFHNIYNFCYLRKIIHTKHQNVNTKFKNITYYYMVICPLLSIILDKCVHSIKFLAKSVELCMKARTQMHISTMKLRCQHNTSIYFTSAERLHQLKLIVYFLKIRTWSHSFQQLLIIHNSCCMNFLL